MLRGREVGLDPSDISYRLLTSNGLTTLDTRSPPKISRSFLTYLLTRTFPMSRFLFVLFPPFSPLFSAGLEALHLLEDSVICRKNGP